MVPANLHQTYKHAFLVNMEHYGTSHSRAAPTVPRLSGSSRRQGVVRCSAAASSRACLKVCIRKASSSCRSWIETCPEAAMFVMLYCIRPVRRVGVDFTINPCLAAHSTTNAPWSPEPDALSPCAAGYGFRPVRRVRVESHLPRRGGKASRVGIRTVELRVSEREK